MEYRLRVKIFSANGTIEGVLADPVRIGSLIGDQITIWAEGCLITLPTESCIRICILPELIEEKRRKIIRTEEQLPMFETRPAS